MGKLQESMISIASLLILLHYGSDPQAATNCRASLTSTHSDRMSIEAETIIECNPPIHKRFVDLTGKKFGRLFVVEWGGMRRGTGKSHPVWLCKCECGVECYKSGKDLKVGDSKSCGCLRKDARTKESEVPPADPGTCHIPLTQGRFMVVDQMDFEAVSQFSWAWDGKYPTRNIQKPNGLRTMQRIHRFLMGEPEGMEVDHRNRITTDNRRCNLRVATRQEGGRNRGKPKHNTSGYKGVRWDGRLKKWVASLTIDRRTKYLGTFDTPQEAHEAYKSGATKFFGEFAAFS